MSLLGLSMALSGIGRADDALAVSEEAAKLWRRLAQASPAGHEPGLAYALGILGIELSEAGRAGEALAVSEEAVLIRRRLAQADPAAYEADLAASLNDLGPRLSEPGQTEQAVAAMREAMEIIRRLARMSPEAYEEDLAAALTNLHEILSRLDRPYTVEAATLMPSTSSSPWIRRYPHPGFSRASRSTSRIERTVRGRPGRRGRDTGLRAGVPGRRDASAAGSPDAPAAGTGRARPAGSQCSSAARNIW
jgi:tetratricopeptide (TPR) repeat protein